MTDKRAAARDPEAREPFATIAAGTGRYADAWHPFVETARAIGDALEDDGWRVRVEADVDAALARLAGPDAAADLLVVDAGDPWRGDTARRGADPDARRGLDAALDRGIGVLSVHNAVSSLRDYPHWRRAIGSEWVVGTTWHPKIGEASVQIVDHEHPVTRGVEDFTLVDERYTDVEIDPGAHVLAVHELEGVAYPLLWVRDPDADAGTGGGDTGGGGPRVVVSALGHDLRSFASPEHRRILAQAARWAGRRPDAHR